MPSQTATVQPIENGQIHNRLVADDPMTAGYRPTLPSWTFWQPDGTPILFVLRDIELMLTHPVIHQALEYYKSGIASAEFDVKCNAREPGQFILDQCQRFWDKGIPKAQNGYEYGWIGGENLYSDDEGPMKWDSLLDFAPRDTFLLTQKSKTIGVRVKNIQDKQDVDLWSDTPNIPAKAFWYAHRPRYGQHYGRSQLLSAWRPWKRLAWKDGLESVIDGGLYRFAYAGPSIRYPPEDYQARPGTPSTTQDSQGRPRRYARDFARQMAEQLRAGGSIALSSEKWPVDQGGHFKWEVEWPDHVLNVDPLLNAAKALQDQIYFGIGVPPELIQAAETGSGYSGRAIPMEAFLMQQQRIADALLDLFVNQILRPLVLWNFGDAVRFEVKVKNLLKTKRQQAGGQEQPGAAQPGAGQQQPPGQPPQQQQPQYNERRVPVVPLSLFLASQRERDIVRQILRGCAA